MKIDIILQGPIYKFTGEIVQYYLQAPFINKLILSCWQSDTVVGEHPKIIVVKNEKNDIKTPGTGNLNYQLRTSLNGVLASDADLIFKTRTDQQIYLYDLGRLVEFFIKNSAIRLPKLDHTQVCGKILCASVFPDFPYHPRDHLFLGYKHDMKCLFDIPFSTQPNYYPDLVRGIRPEAYLGAHYCGKFSEKARIHSLYPEKYLIDNSIGVNEALQESKAILDEIFLVSPRILHIWKKYGIFNFSPLHSPSYNEYVAKEW